MEYRRALSWWAWGIGLFFIAAPVARSMGQSDRVPASCGNEVCEPGETRRTCRQDCGINPPPYHPERQTVLSHGGLMRSYVVHVPPCYRPGGPIPVVMNFHGGGGTGEATEVQIQMNRKADEACFLGVYPNGVSVIGISGKRQHWNAGTRAEFRNQPLDDVGFVRAMLDQLERTYTIDAARVYATGISNGAMMSYRLACELSDRIAAVAPVAGGLVLEDCRPSRPVPILHIHGTADPGWPYEGGPGCFTDDVFAPVAHTIQAWIRLNRCAATSVVTYQRGDVTCRTHLDCAEGADVTLCTIEGGGHVWPGGYSFPAERIMKWDRDCALGRGRGMGNITRDLSAMDAMWEFFEHHPMPSQ